MQTIADLVAVAGIREQRLFLSASPEVRRQFESGEWHLIEQIQYNKTEVIVHYSHTIVHQQL